MILKVPYCSQWKETQTPDWKNKSCGIAALKMVIDFYQPEQTSSIDKLYQMGLDLDGYLENVGWYHHGLSLIAKKLGFRSITRIWSLPEEFDQRLKARGFNEVDLKILTDEQLEEGIFTLKKELESGHPVIISIPRNLEKGGTGHLVTLIGFDKQDFILNDPDDQARDGQEVKISFDKFKEVWVRQAIIIYPQED